MRADSSTVPEVNTDALHAKFTEIGETRKRLVAALRAAGDFDPGAAIHTAQCARQMLPASRDVPALFVDLHLRMQERNAALSVFPTAESLLQHRG